MIGVTSFAASLGPPVFGFAYSFSMAQGFSCPRAWAFTPLLGLLALSFFVRPQDEGDDASRECVLVDASREASIFGNFSEVYRKIGVQAFLLSTLFFASYCLMTSLSCAASIALHSLAFSPAAIGCIMFPAVAIHFVASPFVGRFSNTSARRWGFLAAGTGAFPCGILAVVLIYSGIPMSSYVVSAILGFSRIAVCFIDGPSISLMTEHGSVWGCGKAKSVIASELAVTFGLATGPYMGDVLLHKIGFNGLCYMWALCCGLLALLVVPCVKAPTFLPEGSK
eukprot:TRINITY_DN15346_c0_g1_i1.p1 TRINITY_DN15346_c0_g1~~TRINITY_DN15346_c0_g1_i1.p1  ORF type:complete len:295 (+),score=27.06 TRINITY_DN15346_c0_g1_i1:45-887(+)